MKNAKLLNPLLTQIVPINEHCTGSRWTTVDETRLAQLIAIIAMGQAVNASHILKSLGPAAPAFTSAELRGEAIIGLTVQEDGQKPRTGYPRWQRDGFIFEAISWIAARQSHGESTLLKDPHVSATAQGLDGLMIELSDDKSKLILTTIFEDKCSEDPRAMFTQNVLPGFLKRHHNERSAEVVACASVLLRMAGVSEIAAGQLAAAVMNRKQRCYRSAFALTKASDSQEEREKLFKGFEALDGLTADRRIGAGFIIDGELRDWFDSLASKAIDYLVSLPLDGT